MIVGFSSREVVEGKASASGEGGVDRTECEAVRGEVMTSGS